MMNGGIRTKNLELMRHFDDENLKGYNDLSSKCRKNNF